MLQKITRVFANHGTPLKCDIYTTPDCLKNTPVFLYFHPGGLVCSGRDRVPPWLVQVCHQRKWPLISASYRLLPQTGASGLNEDASAAYEFARGWNLEASTSRPVIVGGGSAGYFLASLVAHHCKPSPLALFSICGINSFRHKFYNSSVLLGLEPVNHASVAQHMVGPAVVGVSPNGLPSTFHLDKLLPDGSKNEAYEQGDDSQVEQDTRGDLFEYYTFHNKWLDLVGSIDPGYEWAKETENSARREAWPSTVIFHGDADEPVPLDVGVQMQENLGHDKVRLFVAPGQEHLFEKLSFIEDDQPWMETVRDAVTCLDKIVSQNMS